jgi:hypothetical protein
MLILRASAILLLLSWFAFAAENTAIWIVDSLIKIFPDDAAEANRNASDLTLLPRNGHASL